MAASTSRSQLANPKIQNPKSKSDVGPTADKTAAKRHLVSHAGQAIAGGRLRHATDFEQHHARLDDGGPVFRLPLALAHARLGGDRGHRLVREHANVQPPLAAQEVRGGDATGLDGLGAQPAAFQRLQAVVAEGHEIAAGCLTSYLSPLTFSELYSLGH